MGRLNRRRFLVGCTASSSLLVPFSSIGSIHFEASALLPFAAQMLRGRNQIAFGIPRPLVEDLELRREVSRLSLSLFLASRGQVSLNPVPGLDWHFRGGLQLSSPIFVDRHKDHAAALLIGPLNHEYDSLAKAAWLASEEGMQFRARMLSEYLSIPFGVRPTETFFVVSQDGLEGPWSWPRNVIGAKLAVSSYALNLQGFPTRMINDYDGFVFAGQGNRFIALSDLSAELTSSILKAHEGNECRQLRCYSTRWFSPMSFELRLSARTRHELEKAISGADLNALIQKSSIRLTEGYAARASQVREKIRPSLDSDPPPRFAKIDNAVHEQASVLRRILKQRSETEVTLSLATKA